MSPPDGHAVPASATICETPLLAGKVEYDPLPLEAPAPGNVLICCARPTEAVVLDL